MRDRLAAAFAHGLPVAGLGMTVERSIDRALRAVGRAPDKGEVLALKVPGPSVVGELAGQRLVGAVVLGDHHEPGRILVEPVHDAGPLHPADARRGLRRNARSAH